MVLCADFAFKCAWVMRKIALIVGACGGRLPCACVEYLISDAAEGVREYKNEDFEVLVNFLFRYGIDGNLLSVFADPFKPYGSVDKRKERIVFAQTYVVAGLEFGAALSYEDIARKHELTVGTLNAEHFGITVSAVV